MKSRLFYGVLMISLNIVLLGCTSRMVKTTERGDKDCKKKVLIATQQSRFKEAVVSRVVAALEKDTCYVKIIDLRKLAGESTENYEAIVIVNTCWAGRLNRHARKFLKNVQEKEKIILLTTAIGEDWKPKAVKVDAVTSASKMNKADAIADLIIDKVQILLAKKTGS